MRVSFWTCVKNFNNQILANLMMGPKVLKFAKKKGAALDNYTY